MSRRHQPRATVPKSIDSGLAAGAVGSPKQLASYFKTRSDAVQDSPNGQIKRGRMMLPLVSDWTGSTAEFTGSCDQSSGYKNVKD